MLINRRTITVGQQILIKYHIFLHYALVTHPSSIPRSCSLSCRDWRDSIAWKSISELGISYSIDSEHFGLLQCLALHSASLTGVRMLELANITPSPRTAEDLEAVVDAVCPHVTQFSESGSMWLPKPLNRKILEEFTLEFTHDIWRRSFATVATERPVGGFFDSGVFPQLKFIKIVGEIQESVELLLQSIGTSCPKLEFLEIEIPGTLSLTSYRRIRDILRFVVSRTNLSHLSLICHLGTIREVFGLDTPVAASWLDLPGTCARNIGLQMSQIDVGRDRKGFWSTCPDDVFSSNLQLQERLFEECFPASNRGLRKAALENLFSRAVVCSDAVFFRVSDQVIAILQDLASFDLFIPSEAQAVVLAIDGLKQLLGRLLAMAFKELKQEDLQSGLLPQFFPENWSPMPAAYGMGMGMATPDAYLSRSLPYSPSPEYYAPQPYEPTYHDSYSPASTAYNPTSPKYGITPKYVELTPEEILRTLPTVLDGIYSSSWSRLTLAARQFIEGLPFSLIFDALPRGNSGSNFLQTADSLLHLCRFVRSTVGFSENWWETGASDLFGGLLHSEASPAAVIGNLPFIPVDEIAQHMQLREIPLLSTVTQDDIFYRMWHLASRSTTPQCQHQFDKFLASVIAAAPSGLTCSATPSTVMMNYMCSSEFRAEAFGALFSDAHFLLEGPRVGFIQNAAACGIHNLKAFFKAHAERYLPQSQDQVEELLFRRIWVEAVLNVDGVAETALAELICKLLQECPIVPPYVSAILNSSSAFACPHGRMHVIKKILAERGV